MALAIEPWTRRAKSKTTRPPSLYTPMHRTYLLIIPYTPESSLPFISSTRKSLPIPQTVVLAFFLPLICPPPHLSFSLSSAGRGSVSPISFSPNLQKLTEA